jgi:mannose-6-phosphate isomerase
MADDKMNAGAIRLVPEYHERVWGGQHLKPDSPRPIGEAWIVHEHDRVASGPYEGKTLGELADKYGEQLLGDVPAKLTGNRFPLLIKLLDCAQWLSLQVHPNDKQAVELEGPGHFGKTEAWYVLDAEPGARLISGIKPGTSPEVLAEAIRNGTLIQHVQYLDVERGDTVMTHAGTVHALGPGLFIYEVQQTSDITYRIYDWDRPRNEGRKLHIEQSVAVSDPARCGESFRPDRPIGDGERQSLARCDYFALELLSGESRTISLDTGGRSFHLLTVIEGRMRVVGEGWSEELGLYDTAIVPAAAGAYRVEPVGSYKALKASVE